MFSSRYQNPGGATRYGADAVTLSPKFSSRYQSPGGATIVVAVLFMASR